MMLLSNCSYVPHLCVNRTMLSTCGIVVNKVALLSELFIQNRLGPLA